MSSLIKLNRSFGMPLQAVTETFGILAARGAGKSNTAAVMAEGMWKNSLPFCVVDPVGAWWGLRSAGAGDAKGYAIPIFGGRHGDVPLERTGGRLVADIVAGDQLTCVLDLTEFESEAAKKQFLLDFAVRLYQKNQDPLHLFLEEADDYIPQRPMRDEARLLRAWENIVRRGRSRGLGMTMITQRSASINKNVLTQVQTLIVMRTTGPQDRKAVEEWVRYNDISRDILSSLSELENGEAWIWSPQFLKCIERIKVRRRWTYDSGATPSVRAQRNPATLADINVESLRSQMADTVARAEAEDPKILHRRIAELERELKAARRAPPEAVVEAETKIRDLTMMVGRLENALSHAADAAAFIMAKAETIKASADLDAGGLFVDTETAMMLKARKVFDPRPQMPANESFSMVTGRSRPDGPADTSLPAGEKRVLIAISQIPDGVSRQQISILTGYKKSSRDVYIRRLAGKFYIDKGPPITATDLGIQALGSEFEVLPTGAELREYWLEELPAGERQILEVLIASYPRTVSRQMLSDRTNYKKSSRDVYIRKLSARQLIASNSSGVRASDMLFS